MASKEELFSGAITVIGGGMMGEAIVRGWLTSGLVSASQVTIVEPSEVRRSMLEDLGVSLAAAIEDIDPITGIVMLAVKPQIIEPVVQSASARLGGALIVSIAVGISSARLESMLPTGTAVVRVMPNTPAMVGEGMAVISGGAEANPDQIELVRALFAGIGDAIVLDERYQNAAAAISGSGPAYFALVVDSLARAGVAAGLTRVVAQQLATQTMLGTARMLQETGMHPEVLVDGVTSPGGTTIAALGRLEAAGLRAAFNDAVKAAVHRSEELG